RFCWTNSPGVSHAGTVSVPRGAPGWNIEPPRARQTAPPSDWNSILPLPPAPDPTCTFEALILGVEIPVLPTCTFDGFQVPPPTVPPTLGVVALVLTVIDLFLFFAIHSLRAWVA